MTRPPDSCKDFRSRLLAFQPLIGAWIKTPSSIIAEVMGRTPLDCICLDAEHAPFDRACIDAALGVCRMCAMPAMTRIPSIDPAPIQTALDAGGTGVIAPHVQNAEDAKRLARLCRYGPDGRGFAASPRAGGYTTCSMTTILREAAARTVTIAQIEDTQGLRNIDAIAAIDGIDCLFIGRADLTVAMQAESTKSKSVMQAVATICKAGRDRGRAVGMFLSDLEEIPHWRALGASFFLLKSDHSFILEGAKALHTQFTRLCGSGA